MVCCHQARSHYLSQCWHSSISSYGIPRPQWVNLADTVLQNYTHSFVSDKESMHSRPHLRSLPTTQRCSLLITQQTNEASSLTRRIQQSTCSHWLHKWADWPIVAIFILKVEDTKINDKKKTQADNDKTATVMKESYINCTFFFFLKFQPFSCSTLFWLNLTL